MEDLSMSTLDPGIGVSKFPDSTKLVSCGRQYIAKGIRVEGVVQWTNQYLKGVQVDVSLGWDCSKSKAEDVLVVAA
jgi:hypothetical protein